MTSPEDVIRALQLQPHPEGGHYREVWRETPLDGSRGAGTAIYFLLASGERSAWHRVDAVEVWHHYAGAPLALATSTDARTVHVRRHGPDLSCGEQPQLVVEAGVWQSARSFGGWTLVGCTVSPAFVFDGFELAPPSLDASLDAAWRSHV